MERRRENEEKEAASGDPEPWIVSVSLYDMDCPAGACGGPRVSISWAICAREQGRQQQVVMQSLMQTSCTNERHNRERGEVCQTTRSIGHDATESSRSTRVTLLDRFEWAPIQAAFFSVLIRCALQSCIRIVSCASASSPVVCFSAASARVLTLSLYLFLISVLFGPAHRQLNGKQRKKMRHDGTISPSPRMRTLRPYWMQGQKKEHKHTPQLPKQPKRPSGERNTQHTHRIRSVLVLVAGGSDSGRGCLCLAAGSCVVRFHS